MVERKQLILGDLQFIKDDKLVFLVERKTVRDLASSYKDGRLMNQVVDYYNSIIILNEHYSIYINKNKKLILKEFRIQ